MSLEQSTELEILPTEGDTLQVAVAIPPREQPRKRYAAPSAPRVMQFMRTAETKA